MLVALGSVAQAEESIVILKAWEKDKVRAALYHLMECVISLPHQLAQLLTGPYDHCSS